MQAGLSGTEANARAQSAVARPMSKDYATQPTTHCATYAQKFFRLTKLSATNKFHRFNPIRRERRDDTDRIVTPL